MAAAQQSQGSGGDNSLAPIWITVSLFVLFAFIWYFFKTYIVWFVYTIKYYEALALVTILPDAWVSPLKDAMFAIKEAAQLNYTSTTVNDIYNVSETVGLYLRFPLIVIFIIMAVYVYYKSPVLHYKKNYDMKKLLAQEKDDWPQITPIANIDLVKQNINQGPWAMSLQPLQFAQKHNILYIEKKQSSEAALQSKSFYVANIRREEARKVFAIQVGHYWQGIDTLPVHTKALFAVFAARIAGERDEPQKLLMQIAASTIKGKLNFHGYEALLKKHQNHKIVQRVITKHAFVLTVMASMLQEARQDGVIASADFLWLKVIDRPLWYMLNSIGRQTPFCEVAGPYAHWIAEKELARKLNLPMIEEAVNGLDLALKEIIYKPEDEE